MCVIYLVALSEETLLQPDTTGVVEFLDDEVFSVFIFFVLVHLFDGHSFAGVLVGGQVHHSEGTVSHHLVHDVVVLYS